MIQPAANDEVQSVEEPSPASLSADDNDLRVCPFRTNANNYMVEDMVRN